MQILRTIFTAFLIFGLSKTYAFALTLGEARIFNRQGVILSNKGQLNEAIEAFKKAFKADPHDDTVRINLATALNNRGVLQFKNGDFQGALKSFEEARVYRPEDLQVRMNLLSALVAIRDFERVDKEARSLLALRPNDPETILKIANAFQRIEDSESARNILERLISVDPQNTAALFSLGRLFYFQGNFSEARYYLERAIESSPCNASAAALLDKISRDELLEKQFEREQSIHFLLSFDERVSRDLAREILDLFEEAYIKIGDALGYYPSQRLNVIVYYPRDFLEINSLPAWAGGLYDGKIRLPIPLGTQNSEELRGAVFHEYTHHIVHILSDGRCPIWLNEGLAQYFEGVSLERARAIILKQPNNWIIQLTVTDPQTLRIKDRSTAEMFYAQSLILTSLILDEVGTTGICAMLAEFAQRKELNDILGNFSLSIDRLVSKVHESLQDFN